MADDRKQGTVARIVREKAYGFIHCPADHRDYFFHQTELIDITLPQVEEGAEMTFVVGEGRGGKPEAQQVKMLWNREVEGKRLKEAREGRDA